MATQKTNQDLSKILRDTGNYQAEYLTLTAANKPVGCILPDMIPGEVNLPPVDLPEIKKACAPDFTAFPLIPEPFAPPESCLDGITFTTKEVKVYSAPGSPVAAIVPVGASQDDSDFCKYNLEIPDIIIPCFPEGPSILGAARINVVDLNEGETTTTEIQLTQDENAICRWILGGDVTITIPEIPCAEGIYFSPSIFKINSTCPTIPSAQQVVQIVPGETSCQYELKMPDITIPCYPNGPQVHGEIKVQLFDQDPTHTNPYHIESAGILDQNTSCCDFELGGTIDIDIPCHTGVQFNNASWTIKPEAITPADKTLSKKIQIKRHVDNNVADICNFDIDFPDIVIPCFPDGIQFNGPITINTLDRTEGAIDFNSVKEAGSCTWDTGEIEINLPLPSCPGGISFKTDIKIKANRGTEIPLVATSDTEGKKRYHNLTLRALGGDPATNKDCGAVLEGELVLGLPPFALQCDRLIVGGRNAVQFSFDTTKPATPVLALQPNADGCGFEFNVGNLNLPVLSCDPDHAFKVENQLEIYRGNNKVDHNVGIQPLYQGSPHCGLKLTGRLNIPDPETGGFNYVRWRYFGPDGRWGSWGSGDVASLVFPEGGRCTYRAMDETGVDANLVPGTTAAQGTWENIGCADDKDFPPFKVIKCKRIDNSPDPQTDNMFVKVVPKSYLFEDMDTTMKVYGLDTPFIIEPGYNIFLEITFDSSGASIIPIYAAIGVGPKWDDREDTIFPKKYLVLNPAKAKELAPTFYNRTQVNNYAGIDDDTRNEIEEAQHGVLEKVGLLADARQRQFKAYVLIASASEGIVVDGTDTLDQVDEPIMLKTQDRTYGIKQELKNHLVLLSTNDNNIPLLIPFPFEGGVPEFPRLAQPAITWSYNGSQFELSFTCPDAIDLKGETRKMGPNSDDIHVYYTTDASFPTINTAENPNAYQYEGGTAIKCYDEIEGGVAFMAVAEGFRRSFIKVEKIDKP